MKCLECLELLSPYRDAELSTEKRTDVDIHLGQCANCKLALTQFNSLGALVTSLDRPETPESVWSAIEQDLASQNREVEAPAETDLKISTRQDDSPAETTHAEGRPVIRIGRRTFMIALTIAATILAGFVGWTQWQEKNMREDMALAMGQVATDIDSDAATTLLLNKFGGSEVTDQEAITQVGYQPIASYGMPDGYSVDGFQILDMPCCKCTQTVCRRPDNSRFFVYEHTNEAPGWFEHQKERQCECNGKQCRIVELENHLAVTWQKGSRHITLLGVRDEAELELILTRFEENS